MYEVDLVSIEIVMKVKQDSGTGGRPTCVPSSTADCQCSCYRGTSSIASDSNIYVYPRFIIIYRNFYAVHLSLQL